MTDPPGISLLPGWLGPITTLCAFGAIVISVISIYMHFKNYRKPMDQRLIVRIQLLLPLFAFSSWVGLRSDRWASVFDPIREIYEAFVIYTFFALLTNLLGGERDVIIATSGRAPKPLVFPLDRLMPGVRVDISDPYIFLLVKRCILQYTWLKPILSLLTITLNAVGRYRPNTISLESGYTWLSVIYNISISISLYSLALFWYLLHDDLAPYRPWPKFLCVKAIIFFSYWQGFGLSILVYLGVIPNNDHNSMAHAIQNCLMCIEMLPFAASHWVAFSYKDYATSSLIGFGRLPVYYAIRDSFGIVDLMNDFMSTFYGSSYGYRQFDSVEAVLDHPESASRSARIMSGLRYMNGGRSKYWLPESTLRKPKYSMETRLINESTNHKTYGVYANGRASVSSINDSYTAASSSSQSSPDLGYDSYEDSQMELALPDQDLDADEQIYTLARRLRYGDYNYPVITVRESESVPAYVPVIDRQSAQGIRTTLAEEYESFGPTDDEDEFNDGFAV